MVRTAAWLVSAAIALIPLRAQDKPDGVALINRENKLMTRSAEALHGIADALQAQKQNLRALQVRREILGDVDENNAKAREKCGFVRVGAVWRRDPNLVVLDKDLAGDAKALKKIDQEIETLGRELGSEHKALAEAWTAQNDTERAKRHWKRVVRWLPGDKTAITALALASFEGFRGTPGELAMLRRARAIRGAVDWLHRSPTAVQRVEGTQALLTAANVGHVGVRSEHFVIWGTMPEATLTKLAQYAERSLLLCHTLLGTSTGQHFRPVKRLEAIFVATADEYMRVLDAAAGQVPADRLEFLKTLDVCYVGPGGRETRLHRCPTGEDIALDQCVRHVVIDALGITTHGVWEGMGHAACGFMFGRTLMFLLEQKHERTSTGQAQQAKIPEFDVWRRIAEESAWSKTDTRTSELVLLNAARFTDEQRVKAWAMCDYLMSTRPELLIALDKCKTAGVNAAPDVEREFQKRTSVSLPSLDEEWREYWAKGAVLRTAMAKDPLGAEKAPDRALRVRAKSLVDEVDVVRAAALRGPVGFFVADASDAVEAAQYTDKLIKAELEQKRGRAKKPPVEVPLPPVPATFGVSVFWSRKEKAADAVAEWMQQPALRDVLLHSGRGLFGSALSANSWVLDVALPAQPTVSGPPLCWPREGQKDVPGSARVADLGPRAVAALAAEGKQADEVVGMPVTLHFARSVPAATLAQVKCTLFAGSMKKAGVLVPYETDPATADAAPGCVAFVPFEPLAAGEMEVVWQVPTQLLGKDELAPGAHFTVK